MAKLRMTYKNLKALRKTREYQALLVDLVANNIVPKSVAENLLGYNIPANLIGGESSEEEPVVTPDNGEQGSGTEGSESDTGNTVTLLYFDSTANDGDGDWLTAAYTLTGEDTTADLIAAAKTAFGDDAINGVYAVEEDSAYTELVDKYVPLDPQPETLESGMLFCSDNTAILGN
jgi:hypothetical protein